MEPISVLIVDDNPTFLKIAARFLQEHEDITVIGTACDGDHALHQAQLLHPQVILLDLDMPGTNGLDAIPLLREKVPEVQIIVLTILDAQVYRAAALAAGADDFISKTELNVELIPSIRQVTAGDFEPGNSQDLDQDLSFKGRLNGS